MTAMFSYFSEYNFYKREMNKLVCILNLLRLSNFLPAEVVGTRFDGRCSIA